MRANHSCWSLLSRSFGSSPKRKGMHYLHKHLIYIRTLISIYSLLLYNPMNNVVK